jgi:hypothetical protein
MVPRDLLTKAAALAAMFVAGLVLAIAGCGDEDGGSVTTVTETITTAGTTTNNFTTNDSTTNGTTTEQTTTEDTTTGETETETETD